MRAGVRLLGGVIVGGVVGVLAAPAGIMIAVMSGWIAAALTFSGWTWLSVRHLDPDQTRQHATRDDPSRAGAHVILLVASVASVAGVGLLLSGASHQGPVIVEAALGVAGVAASWLTVHLIYTLHYAALYCAAHQKAPVDFNGDSPDYHDFAYLAFTLGMTYQVSDTNIQNRAIRRETLRHALLSYLLGAVVIACTINLVVQLASGSS